MSDKVVTDNIWYTDDGKVVSIGFNRSFLDRMAECWHIMPAHHQRVREKSPLITIESNEEMFSIPSPITGNIRNFNDKASNFPDRLTDNDVICQIVRGDAVVVKQKAKVSMQEFNPFAQTNPVPELDVVEARQRDQRDMLQARIDAVLTQRNTVRPVRGTGNQQTATTAEQAWPRFLNENN